MTDVATTTDIAIKPVRPVWIGLGLLLNGCLAGGALLLGSVVGMRKDTAGVVVLALLLAVAAWTAFNATMIFALALKRTSFFRVVIRPGHLEFETTQGNLILFPADVEKYVLYSNKIVFRHPGKQGPSYRPFLRGGSDATTLYTLLLSGGQAVIRRQLAVFDPDFGSKQAHTPGSILSRFVS